MSPVLPQRVKGPRRRCALFVTDEVNYSGCSAKELKDDGSSDYEAVLETYGDAVAACAASDGATGFRWFRPCQWQLIAQMPETCAGRAALAPPAAAAWAAGALGVKDPEAVCAAVTGEPYAAFDGHTCAPCQANAYCSYCAGNAYCAAFVAQHPGMAGRVSTFADVPDVFFGELDFWCDAAVLASVAEGTFAATRAWP